MSPRTSLIRISGPPVRRGLPRPDRRRLRRGAARVLAELDQAEAELSLVLLADAEMAELNARWRSRSGPTDVLSFSLLEGAGSQHRQLLLGDVVIGVEVAARQAQGARHSLDDEVARLLIHGVLHLLGFDHEVKAEARRMRSEERRLWRAIAP